MEEGWNGGVNFFLPSGISGLSLIFMGSLYSVKHPDADGGVPKLLRTAATVRIEIKLEWWIKGYGRSRATSEVACPGVWG